MDDYKELKSLPKMTTWFSPDTLLKTIWRAISSTLFGEYADNRLIQAALNPYDPTTCSSDTDFKHIGNSEQGTWIDYVADTGDGFDSTYSVAYLLGRKNLDIKFKEQDLSLPRGQLLIMGGDQVYPFAEKNEYKRKLLDPYSFSFPESNTPESDNPPLFLIPGNHDWYDGLRIFSALFCRGKNWKNKPYSFGNSSWNTCQKRSYFAIELTNNWWIWAIDTQLTEDIDKPQSDYFIKIANNISKKEKIKIIFCVSEPNWLYINPDQSKPSKLDMGVQYINENIVKEILPNAKIYAVLSGDSHHYNHYKAENSGTHFITAGGGGAFLHPTHHLEDVITNIRWGNEDEVLILETDPNSNEDTCFPTKKDSKKLARGNWRFPLLNKSFFLILGSIYLFFAAILSASGQLPLNLNIHKIPLCLTDLVIFVSHNIVLVILFLVFLYMGHKYAVNGDIKKITKYNGLIHGAIQFAWLLSCIYILDIFYSKVQLIHEVPYFIVFSAWILCIGGLFGSLFFGFVTAHPSSRAQRGISLI